MGAELEDGTAGLADESHWTVLRADDDLRAAPRTLAPPLTDPALRLLNTDDLDWEDFERLVVALAMNEGAVDARRYGKPGQVQHGIDVVGFFADGGTTVYQAKRQAGFTASDLETAVGRCALGVRPFGAERIVVAVATEAREKTVIEMLHSVQQAHPDLAIELWDQGKISDMLRKKPDVVVTFFGQATAARFCPSMPGPPAPPPGSVSADAILRGPIAHLGLEEELRQAEAVLDADPQRAASGLDAVALRLEASVFAGHAVRVREQQAAALQAAGQHGESCAILLSVGWRLLESGDPFFALNQAQAMSKLTDLPESLVRAVNALGVAAAYRHRHDVTLDDLASVYDDLHINDPHAVDMSVLLAEEAVAARRPEFVLSRRTTLAALIEVQPKTEAGFDTAARLRMCLADSDGDWDALAVGARASYPPRIAAWTLARHARHLALTLRPELSTQRWLDAIERACTERLYDDAADWLYALRAVKIQYGYLDEDLNDLHRRAQALRSSGAGSVLPRPYPANERALANMLDENWPDALESLRRHLWHCTVAADWAAEVYAHKRLGRLYARVGKRADAVRHLIFGGDEKNLKALAAEWPDEPVRLAPDILGSAPWERGAVYVFVSKIADLLVDEDAAQWAALAQREIVVASGPVTLLANHHVRGAFEAFGQLSSLCSEAGAREFLELGAELVPREPNTYRVTDDAHAAATVGIAHAHPALRTWALEQLIGLWLSVESVSDSVATAADLLRAERSAVAHLLVGPIADRSARAAQAWLVCGGDPAVVVPVARELCAAATAPRLHQPGVRQYGTNVGIAASLVRVLDESERVTFARRMIEFAADRQQPSLNRAEFLQALGHVADEIPERDRDEIFELAMAFARGEYDGETDEGMPEELSDPLSRFRFSLGSASLGSAGLLAACALARTPDHYIAVQAAAQVILRGSDDSAINAAARTMSLIPPEYVSVDLAFLAAHPIVWMRSLAAVVWAKRPDGDRDIGERLARDSARHVRASLASALRDTEGSSYVRAILAVDPRRSIRRLARK